ncbi:MAG: leucyl aminopeptidase family protein [Caulobacterales bacterium]|jgi:leucyl aminopeptidase
MTPTDVLIAESAHPVPIHLVTAAEWPTWLAARPESFKLIAAAVDFRAQAGRVLIAPATDGAVERVVLGLGDRISPMLVGALGRDLPTGEYKIASKPQGVDPTLAAIAFALGVYAFDKYKPRKRATPKLVAPEGCDLAEAVRVAEAVWLVRDLVNTPANDMGPSALQAAAERVAQRYGAEIETVVGDDLLTAGYPMIHAVGRAAADAPRFVHLKWGAAGAPRIALVGKGVTFDSGGLDIKPDAGMRLMKKDMGGAAHALALGQLVMDAHLPVELHVILPIVENAISGAAFRPGDVIATRKGLYIEIDNTDAEGRLILADALTRASELEPELILDFATLTGAARVALGPDVPPLFTDDDALAADLAAASTETFDPLWRLPLWAGYESDMDSAIADLKNTGDAGFAGAIFGGLFLKRFVTAKSWAHFDVFAWAPRDKPARPAGGEAHALRACWRVLRKRYRR